MTGTKISVSSRSCPRVVAKACSSRCRARWCLVPDSHVSMQISSVVSVIGLSWVTDSWRLPLCSPLFQVWLTLLMPQNPSWEHGKPLNSLLVYSEAMGDLGWDRVKWGAELDVYITATSTVVFLGPLLRNLTSFSALFSSLWLPSV